MNCPDELFNNPFFLFVFFFSYVSSFLTFVVCLYVVLFLLLASGY